MPAAPPGRYRCSQVTPPVPGGYSFDVKVSSGGAWSGFLYYTYYPEQGVYSAGPGLTFECTGTGTYSASSPLGPVTGTCVPLP